MQRFSLRSQKVFLFFVLLFSFSLLSQTKPAKKQVTLLQFLPYNSTKDELVEKKIAEQLQQALQDSAYSVVETSRIGISENLQEAKLQASSYMIGGYYHKKSGENLEIYVQIYNPDTAEVIDAINLTQKIPELQGIDLDKEEMKVSDDTVIRQAAGKTLIKIRSNPKRKIRNRNIEENLSSKDLAKQIKFPIRKEDIVKQSEEVFKLLGETEVVTASRTKESLFDVPASIVVLSEQEIRDRGYTSLDEIFEDLPGFDAVRTYGTDHMNAYQRGYRTPFFQRTILMFNGISENDLYAQVATVTRQYPISNIKRIEVVYGPASAVYGPNAFLGIVNVITKDGTEIDKDSVNGEVNLQYGSFNTRSIDAAGRARYGDFSLAVSGKYFQSDDPDFSNRGGYWSDYWVGNPRVWGSLLYYGDAGKPFGKYSDPARNWGSVIHMTYKNLKIGIVNWDKTEGYGPYYAGDRGQPMTQWSKNSGQYYFEYTHKFGEKFSSYSLLLYRDSQIYGNWGEASPDGEEGQEDYSYVSYTRWNTENSSILVNQNFDYRYNRNFQFLFGLKGEVKKLTRNYDIPGYWDAYSSRPYIVDENLYPNGFGVVHSSNLLYWKPPSPNERRMPLDNLIATTDQGGFFVSIIDWRKFRFSPGIRYDFNSLYGQSINPRITGIYKYSPRTAFKLLYGEAFNEPSPIQLFGGWNGRNSNPNLKPEKARSYEAIAMHQTKFALHEISAYYSRYSNVIKEEAENAGQRRIYGGEYKLKMNFKNFWQNARPIGIYLYYTYLEALSEIYYDHQLGEWKTGRTVFKQYEYLFPDIAPFLPRQEYYSTLGDISPHKLSLGLNLPIKKLFNVNLRAFYVSKRQFYSRNPLRADGKTLSPHFILNSAFRYHFWQHGFVTLKVLNVFNHTYSVPGPEAAGAGDNYYERSKDFQSSTLPQPGRNYLMTLTVKF